MSDYVLQHIVVMTRQGRMIGISVEGGPDAAMARSVLASVAELCNIADEKMGYSVRGCHVDGCTTDPSSVAPLRTWDARWHPMGIPFGERSGR